MSLLMPFDTAIQPPIPSRWRLSDPARAYIVGVQEQRPDLEATFVCGVNLAERLVTTATLCGWGTATEGFVARHDFPSGSLMVHTHPGLSHQEARGSAPDLRCAMDLAERGVGFGVVNGDGIGLFVMREPRPTCEPATKTRVWKLGKRFMLIRVS